MGIHLTRNNQTILFYPIFILRRVVFVFAAQINLESCFQLQALVFSETVYIMWYVSVRPHIYYRFEIINYCGLQVLHYHMMTFSSFNLNQNAKFKMGVSYFVILFALIAINLIFMFSQSITTFIRRRILIKQQEEKRKTLEMKRMITPRRLGVVIGNKGKLSTIIEEEVEEEESQEDQDNDHIQKKLQKVRRRSTILLQKMSS